MQWMTSMASCLLSPESRPWWLMNKTRFVSVLCVTAQDLWVWCLTGISTVRCSRAKHMSGGVWHRGALLLAGCAVGEDRASTSSALGRCAGETGKRGDLWWMDAYWHMLYIPYLHKLSNTQREKMSTPTSVKMG